MLEMNGDVGADDGYLQAVKVVEQKKKSLCSSDFVH